MLIDAPYPSTLDAAEKLQRIIDRDEIRDLMLRYARGINRQDWELVLSCYHPDAVEAHLPFWGPGRPDAFVRWVQGEMANYESVVTFIGNQLIEVYDDAAWGEVYSLNVQRQSDADGSVFHLYGHVRYCIRYERRDGIWRFAARELFIDTGGYEPVPGIPVAGQDGTVAAVKAAPTGRFDTADPSYRLRAHIRKDASL
jgi:ketosteroid isomerase-like protein